MVTVLIENGVDFWSLGALPLGIALDLTLGGSARKPCPEAAIRPLARLADRALRGLAVRKKASPRGELLAGVLLAVVVVGLVAGLAWLVVEVLGLFDGPINLIGRGILIAWGLSLGRLGGEAIRASEAVDLATARRLASNLAGLGAARLDLTGIRRACVEGIGGRTYRQAVAPLFWLAIAGPAGLWGYLAILTLVETVDGGPRSRFFGFAAARLDDLANFAPARLSWLLLALSGALLGEDAAAAFRSGLAEGRRHPDQPAPWGSATLAAALGLPPGVGAAAVDASIVRRAVRIARVAALHAAALALAYRIVIWGS